MEYATVKLIKRIGAAMAVDTSDPVAMEQWFSSEGTPTLIRHYSFRRHVLPRALSFMAACGLTVLVIALGNSSGAMLLIMLVSSVAAWFGFRLARRSQRTLVARIATGAMHMIWLTWPVAIPLLVAATRPASDLGILLPSHEADKWYELVYDSKYPITVGDVWAEAGVAIGYLVGLWIFVSIFALMITWFGVFRLVGRALRDLAQHAFDLLHILSRTMPAMVFLTLFLFVNADMWQASELLTPLRLVVALTIFGGIAFLATAAQLREERNQLMERGATVPSEVESRYHASENVQLPILPPLTWTQRMNVVMAFGARQIALSVWVGLGVFVFLMALGVTIIPAKTAARWIGADYQELSWLPIPVALVHAAVLLAGFAAMYFAVMSMTDPAYRETFFAPTARDLQEILRIHAAYAAIVGASETGADARTIAQRAVTRVRSNFREALDDSYRRIRYLGRRFPRSGRADGGDASAESAEDDGPGR
ncbi:hypothetical protein [Nonomuraea sp. GTA35]|uniref:hypothetical protein n=1 Tax=Nonomuraea sp. GTA35 TaxID=1676746 RepID=UPI0035C02FF5